MQLRASQDIGKITATRGGANAPPATAGPMPMAAAHGMAAAHAMAAAHGMAAAGNARAQGSGRERGGTQERAPRLSTVETAMQAIRVRVELLIGHLCNHA